MTEGRVLSKIRRYLPDIYNDQMVVDFECGCWQGSREETFRFDCPKHKPGRGVSRSFVWDEVQAERARAHAKHGDTSMEELPVDDLTRLTVLMEEVGEVARWFNENRHGRDLPTGELRAELIQVAAMAGAWADALTPYTPCPSGDTDCTVDCGRCKGGQSGRLSSYEPSPFPLAEQIARAFHEQYERLAPGFGYRTRKGSAMPWEQVPDANRRLMVAVVYDLLASAVIEPGGAL